MRFATTLAIASKAILILLANPARAAINPSAKGACEPTQGGANACGPNGSQEWLNTGVRDQGWKPPFLHMDNLTHLPLKDFYKGVGSPCEKFDAFFKISGMKYKVDPAILAFVAMQESSCNADADSQGPTPGLMQCDPVYCQNGKHSCQFPIQDNTDCGAHLLRVALNLSKGNIVQALGFHNGWFTADGGTGLADSQGITEKYPCSEEGRLHRVPQNLNYLHEMLNGWFQGYDMDGEDKHLHGTYGCA